MHVLEKIKPLATSSYWYDIDFYFIFKLNTLEPLLL